MINYTLYELKYIDELKRLELPENEYAVFGSGPLAIRNLRENGDIDIVVKPVLWENLLYIFPAENARLIRVNHLEIYKDWAPWYTDVNSLIDNADIIDGIRYVKLENVVYWKKEMNREKDRNDLALIESYLISQDNKS